MGAARLAAGRLNVRSEQPGSVCYVVLMSLASPGLSQVAPSGFAGGGTKKPATARVRAEAGFMTSSPDPYMTSNGIGVVASSRCIQLEMCVLY